MDSTSTTRDKSVSWNNRTLDADVTTVNTTFVPYNNDFSDNGLLIINNSTNSDQQTILGNQVSADDGTADNHMTFFEGGENSGIFYNTDDSDVSNLIVNATAKRGMTATFDYNDSAQSFIVANDFGTIDMVESSVGAEWNSGENLVVTIVDQDLNKNSLIDEDMTLRTHNTTIPALRIGSPITLDDYSTLFMHTTAGAFVKANMNVTSFNSIATITEQQHPLLTLVLQLELDLMSRSPLLVLP